MIVVTGGAGFIGSNVVAALNAQGEAPVVCDRMGTDERWRNLARHEIHDLIPPEALEDWLDANRSGVEAVVHLGAISSTTETDVGRLAADNVRPTLDLWTWCGRHDVRFVYASSAATYGDGSQGFDDDAAPEALARLKPLNAYGWSKHVADRRIARDVAADRDRPAAWAGLKFFNVYGPNEYHKQGMMSVVASRWADIAAGRRVSLFKSHHPDYADGGQLRDFIHVEDAAAVILFCLEAPAIEGIFNVGTGRARSFADLIGAAFRAAGREPAIDYVEMPEHLRAKYQYFTQARMDRLRAAGYTAPFLDVEEGVGRYVQRYLAADDPYA